MSKESEEQVRESHAPYVTTTVDTAVEERTLEQFQVQFPPYFDRFLDERDRRVASELERLEAAVEHNGAKITHMRLEMDRRFAEAKEDRKILRADARSQFRWIVGLLFPLVVGVIAVIIRVFLVGTF